MTKEETTANGVEPFPTLSKRGARRVIQRAFVLVGRDRAIRQNLRKVELNIHWTIHDWELEWTVFIDRGRLEFHRGHVGKAQVNYVWQTGEVFLGQVATKVVPKDGFELVCDPAWRRVVDPVFNAFCAALDAVLSDRVDENGERLL